MFDLGAFLSALIGGAIMAALMYKVMEKLNGVVNEETIRRVEGLTAKVMAEQRLLHEKLNKLENDVEALKLDVAELHDALHNILADRRSEMEDWD